MAKSEIELIGAFYIGREKEDETDGGWRIKVIGDNLQIQRKESGVWINKTTITP